MFGRRGWRLTSAEQRRRRIVQLSACVASGADSFGFTTAPCCPSARDARESSVAGRTGSRQVVFAQSSERDDAARMNAYSRPSIDLHRRHRNAEALTAVRKNMASSRTSAMAGGGYSWTLLAILLIDREAGACAVLRSRRRDFAHDVRLLLVLTLCSGASVGRSALALSAWALSPPGALGAGDAGVARRTVRDSNGTWRVGWLVTS